MPIGSRFRGNPIDDYNSVHALVDNSHNKLVRSGARAKNSNSLAVISLNRKVNPSIANNDDL